VFFSNNKAGQPPPKWSMRGTLVAAEAIKPKLFTRVPLEARTNVQSSLIGFTNLSELV
jgi:hypothetical protein